MDLESVRRVGCDTLRIRCSRKISGLQDQIFVLMPPQLAELVPPCGISAAKREPDFRRERAGGFWFGVSQLGPQNFTSLNDAMALI